MRSWWKCSYGIMVATMLYALLPAGHASAAAFNARGEIFFPDTNRVIDDYNVSGFLQAGGEALLDGTSSFFQANSIADIAGIRAHAFGMAESDFFGTLAWAEARGRYDNIVVEGPPGTVNASINLHLSGNMSVFSTAGGSASSSVTLFVNINDDSIVREDFLYFSSTNGEPMFVNASGVLTDWRPDVGTITTPTFSVQAGEPFSIELVMTASISVGGDFPSANSDFGSTLSFAIDGPVFNLPANYTVNGSEAGIVDNEFVVPEPAAILLAALGAAMMLGAKVTQPSGGSSGGA